MSATQLQRREDASNPGVHNAAFERKFRRGAFDEEEEKFFEQVRDRATKVPLARRMIVSPRNLEENQRAFSKTELSICARSKSSKSIIPAGRTNHNNSAMGF